MMVAKLRLAGEVEVDRDRLEQLYGQLGSNNADGVISRAMEELATRLTKVEAAHKAGQFEDLHKAAKSMVAISEQIGLRTFSSVAKDVAGLARDDDGTALAACVARLMRIGENSLLAVWDMQGASI